MGLLLAYATHPLLLVLVTHEKFKMPGTDFLNVSNPLEHSCNIFLAGVIFCS